MTAKTYLLPSGGAFEVQSSYALESAVGVEQASAIDEKAGQAWSEAMSKVAQIAEQTVVKLKKVTAGCKEVEVEFGVNIGGKTGVILVEGTVDANLKVTLKW